MPVSGLHVISPEQVELYMSNVGGIFTCELCGKRFPQNKSNCKRHILFLHTATSQADCPQCGKTYRTEQSMKSHMRQTHGVYSKWFFLLCFRKVNKIDNILLEGFVAEEFISSGVDGRASCTICGKGFIQKSDAKRHIVAKHSGIAQKVECEFCGKTFKNKQSLGSHARVAHNAYKTSL